MTYHLCHCQVTQSSQRQCHCQGDATTVYILQVEPMTFRVCIQTQQAETLTFRVYFLGFQTGPCLSGFACRSACQDPYISGSESPGSTSRGATRGPSDTSCRGCWPLPPGCSPDSLPRQTWPGLERDRQRTL